VKLFYLLYVNSNTATGGCFHTRCVSTALRVWSSSASTPQSPTMSSAEASSRIKISEEINAHGRVIVMQLCGWAWLCGDY
jgi:hypothetical protein